MVRRKHPLYDTAIWKTLPYLKPIKDYLPEWFPRSKDEQLIKQDGRENAGHVEKLVTEEEKKGSGAAPISLDKLKSILSIRSDNNAQGTSVNQQDEEQ